MARSWAFTLIGLAAGFSGVAVIATILTHTSLLLLEAALAVVCLGFAAILLLRVPRELARQVLHVVWAGLAAGFVGTIAYDVTRIALAWLDPSPYSPFGAIRQFGLGIVGANADPLLIMVAGYGVHFVNGSSFGAIYALFAGRRIRARWAAALAGIVWGVFLVALQGILYPGWLRIGEMMAEFLAIAGLGHVAYGATLGLGVRWLLRDSLAPAGADELHLPSAQSGP
jgi:hypothetical protein